MTAAWTTDELDRIGAADELHIASRRTDGTLRRPLPIWVTRVSDELYIRSWRGTDGSWYRAAQTSGEAHVNAGGVERDVVLEPIDSDAIDDAIDAAYRDKYSRYPSYVEPMISDQARATTLRLVPRTSQDVA
jgi:hypothetical protein